jgi:hypothetical protein
VVYPTRYIKTTDEFIAHWTLVNSAINPDLKLSGNYGITSFVNDRIALAASMDALVARENEVEGLMATRDNLRQGLQRRVWHFNALVRGLFPRSAYSRMLPRLPKQDSAPKVWMQAMAEAANVWALIDAMMPVPAGITLPLSLAGGYTRTQFDADVATLLATYNALDTALAARRSSIEARDATWAAMQARMVQYRLTVQGRLESGAALLGSLPRLSPKYKPRPKEAPPTNP